MFQGFNKRFADLNVGIKLIIGFGALVFLVTAVAVTSFITGNIEGQALEEATTASDEVARAEKIELLLEEARVLEREFRLQANTIGADVAAEQFIVPAQVLLDEARLEIDELEIGVQSAELAEAQLVELNNLRDLLNQYESTVAEEVENLGTLGTESTGLIGTLIGDFNALEEQADAAGNFELEAKAAEAEVIALEYIFAPNDELVPVFEERAGEVHSVIQRSELSIADRNLLLSELEEAEATFAQIVEIEALLEEEAAELTVITTALLEQADTFIAEERLEEQAALERFAAAEQASTVIDIVLFAFALITGTGLAIIITRLITRQTDALERLFRQIAIGEFGARADVYSEDELGRATGGVNAMLDRLLEILNATEEERAELEAEVRQLVEDVSELASGDLTITAEASEDAATRAIADALNFAIGELRGLVGNVEESAAEVATTSSWMSQVVDDMVSQTATSAQVAEQAADSAREGGQAVDNTIASMARIRENTQETARRMKRLGEVTQEISEAVQLIEELSDRTTVLALNASIQAAAAGDAGRGFAVVADEVQRLAERATGATRQIEDLVKSIQSETNEAVVGVEEATREVVEGSQLAQSAGERMSELNELVVGLANLIDDVSSRTALQTQNSLITLSNLSTDLQTSVSAFRATDAVTAGNGNGSGNGAVQTS